MSCWNIFGVWCELVHSMSAWKVFIRNRPNEQHRVYRMRCIQNYINRGRVFLLIKVSRRNIYDVAPANDRWVAVGILGQ